MPNKNRQHASSQLIDDIRSLVSSPLHSTT